MVRLIPPVVLFFFLAGYSSAQEKSSSCFNATKIAEFREEVLAHQDAMFMALKKYLDASKAESSAIEAVNICKRESFWCLSEKRMMEKARAETEMSQQALDTQQVIVKAALLRLQLANANPCSL